MSVRHRLRCAQVPRRRAGARAAAGLGACLLGACLLGGAGLRINTSPSIPLGLYAARPGPVLTGAYVMFCPPPSTLFALARARGYLAPGPCPGGYGYLMKKVVAAEADHVQFAADGVRVNGRLLARSAPLPADPAGRALPRLRAQAQTLRAGELLLMSDMRRNAFDARYFGPVDGMQVDSVIVPLLTWGAPTAAPAPDGAGLSASPALPRRISP